MFNTNITEENKVLLNKVIDIIGKTLENEGYINARVSSKRSVDLSLTPINLVALGFTKENIQYKISIEIMDSK